MSDPVYFDEDSRPVPAVEFQYPADEPEATPGRPETWQALFDYVGSAGSREIIGDRHLMLAFIMHFSSAPKSYRDLANELGMTLGTCYRRVERAKHELRAFIEASGTDCPYL
jgi:hypothetical protein